MNTDLLLTWVADASIGSAIIFALAFGATLLLRRSSAAIRHLVWTAAFIGCVMYAGALLLPKWQVPILEASVAPVAALTPPLIVNTTVEAAPIPKSLVPPTPEPALRPKHLVRFIWSAVALALLVRLAAGLVALWRINRSAVAHEIPLPPPPRATAWLSPEVTLPLTWGWLCPQILLPMEFSTWRAEEQRFALLHELAHVRRHDWAVQMLAQFVRAIFWFNPLAWIAVRQLSIEQEKAADDLVLAESQATSYASVLVELAKRLQFGTPRLPALPVLRGGSLEARVRSLLNPKASRRQPAFLHLFATLGLLLAAALVGVVQLTAKEPARSPARALNEMEQRLIGKWQGGGMFATEMEFRADRTYSSTPAAETNLTRGTWSIEGDLLSYTPTSPTNYPTRQRRILQVSSNFFQWQFVGEQSKNIFGWHRLTNIQLGTIAGNVLRLGKPMPNTAVLLEPFTPDGTRLPTTETRTDAEGHFAFHGLAPGHYRVSRSIEWDSVTDQGSSRTGTWTHGQLVEVEKDKTHNITLGQGRTVKGKIFPPPGVDAAKIAFSAGDYRFLTPVKRPRNLPSPVYVLELHKDGSFVIPDVPPGDYTLFATVRHKDGRLDGPEFASVQSSVVSVPDRAGELDLGRFELKLTER
jgi:beta-lactamase regulating signal transducer with metallopeptidase domain